MFTRNAMKTQYVACLRLTKAQTNGMTYTRKMSLVSSPRQEASSLPRPPSAIPGPRRWPVLGSIPSLMVRKDWKLDEMHLVWAQLAKEHDHIFRIDTPGQRSRVFLSDPKDIEHLMRETFDMPTKPMFDILSAIRNSSTNLVKGQAGIMAQQGEEWWRMRRLTQVPTMKVKTVAHYLPQTDLVAQDFLDRMLQIRMENQQMPDYFLDELFKWALESLGLITFNKRIGCIKSSPEGQHVIKLVQDMFEGMGDCVMKPLSLWRYFETQGYKKLKEASDQLEEYILANIDDTAAGLEKSDKDELSLLEKLILMPNLGKSDVLAFMLDFIFAGIDNTSTTVAFTMANLAKHPEKQRKLQEELDQVLGDGSQTLLPAHLARLSYTKACVKESLRLFPVSIGVPRLLEQDIVLGGYMVPKGFEVLVNLMAAGLHEDYFSNPSEFLPERWVRGLGEKVNAYASLPFGTGTRMCIGRRLAEQEIHTLIARMFHKFDISWTHDEIGSKMNFLLFPNRSLNFTVTERK